MQSGKKLEQQSDAHPTVTQVCNNACANAMKFSANLSAHSPNQHAVLFQEPKFAAPAEHVVCP
jgi:hypothetical protein